MTLVVDDLSVSYGRVPALAGVSLRVDEGEYVGLLGPNGAGKTTLLKTLSGTVDSHGGRASFGGQALLALPGHRRTDLGIVHVPQGRGVFNRLTVEENLRLGAYRPAARPRYAERLALVLDLFPVLGEMRRAFAGVLSGGQQQMLAVGRGLMACPRLLVLDEPSLGLAPLVVQQIVEALQRLRTMERFGVLLVEQRTQEVLTLCDRLYILESGRIVGEGTTAELATSRGQILEAYLGA